MKKDQKLLENLYHSIAQNEESPYTSKLTKKEADYINIVTDISLQRLLESPRKYISFAELDKCFSTIFSNLNYEQSNAVFNFFKHILSKVLTAKNSSLYAYMHHWREIPKTEEEKRIVKRKLLEEISTLLCQEFEKFEKYGVPSYFSYHQLLQIYVDNRKIQNLETKLPELKGLFQ